MKRDAWSGFHPALGKAFLLLLVLFVPTVMMLLHSPQRLPQAEPETVIGICLAV